MTMHPARRTIMAAILAPLLPLSAPATAAEPDLPAMQADAQSIVAAWTKLNDIVASQDCTHLAVSKSTYHYAIKTRIESYDIIKTNSLIAPYQLKIDMDASMLTTLMAPTADVDDKRGAPLCFSNAESSIDALKATAPKRTTEGHVTYSWEDGQWRLLDTSKFIAEILAFRTSREYKTVIAEITRR